MATTPIDPADHLGLVKFMARRYLARGLDLDDLIGEGNLGLVKAVRTFDPARGVAFSSYAASCIRYEILAALENVARPLRIPHNVRMALRRGLTADSPNLSAGRQYSLARAVAAMAAGEATDGGLETQNLASIVPDHPHREAESLEDAGICLAVLTDREATVLRYRFGLDDYPTATLEETGAVLRLTKERVRQLEMQALGRLREAVGAERQPGARRVVTRVLTAGGAA